MDELWRTEALEAAVEDCWQLGCPVAGGDKQRVAQIAERRWLARTADLTKGLIAQLESDPGLVGPLKEDYEFLATALYRAWKLAPWKRACTLHPIGERRIVSVDEVVSFGVFTQMDDTEIRGLLMWINIPTEEQVQLQAAKPGDTFDAIVNWHPDHHRQIGLTRIGVDVHPLSKSQSHS